MGNVDSNPVAPSRLLIEDEVVTGLLSAPRARAEGNLMRPDIHGEPTPPIVDVNRQQSISISGKHHPENHKGEGSRPSLPLEQMSQALGASVGNKGARERLD
jgi:hypothetical protein